MQLENIIPNPIYNQSTFYFSFIKLLILIRQLPILKQDSNDYKR